MRYGNASDLLCGALRRGEGHKWLTVVPRQPARQRLQQHLTDRLGTAFGLRIETFRGLEQMLASTLHGVPSVLPDYVVGEILRSLATPELADLLAGRGARAAAVATIEELRLSGVGAGHLRSAGGLKLSALADLLENYQDFIIRNGRGYTDSAGRTIAILETLECRGAFPHGIENILVTGFPSLQPHQVRLLRSLAARARVILRLPGDGGRTGLFEDNESLIESAGTWAEAEIIDPAEGTGALGEMQRRLFASDLTAVAGASDRVAVYSAHGRFDEAEEAARLVDELLARGVPPRGIGITVRDLGAYDQYIRDVLERQGIPYHLRRGFPLLQAPLVRLAMKLTEFPGKSIRFDALLAVFKSAYFAPPLGRSLQELIPDSGIYEEDLAGWSRRLRRHASRSHRKGVAEAAAAAFAEFAEDCLSLNSRRPSVLHDLLAICSKWLSLPEASGPGASADGCEPESQRDARSWHALSRLVDENAEQRALLAKLGVADGDEPFAALREAVRGSTLPLHSRVVDAVQVLNFFDMGYVEVDHLFFLGMDEGSVPGAPFQSRTLLSDHDVSRLRETCPEAMNLTDSAGRRRLDGQAFLLAFSAASETVTLSRPKYDPGGKELAKSSYLAEIETLAGGGSADQEAATIAGGDFRDFSDLPFNRLALRRQAARRLFRSIPISESEDRLLPAVYNQLLPIDSERAFLRRLLKLREIDDLRRTALFATDERRHREVSSKWSGSIRDTDLDAILRERFGAPEYAWSQEALSTYGACPFEFFLKYCLRLRELEPPAEEIPRRDQGILIHRVLKSFTDSFAYPIRDVEEATGVLHAALDKEIERRYGLDPAGGLPPVAETVRGSLRWALRRFLLVEEGRQDCRPIKTEFVFDTEAKPCVLSLGARDIRLEGRIDRIDEQEGKRDFDLLIIDYKLGKGAPPKLADCLLGADLQLPFYLYAVSALENIPLGRLKAAFFGLREKELKKALKELDPHKESDKSDWPAFFELKRSTEIRPFPVVVLSLVDDILSGYFPVEGRGDREVPRMVNLVGRWLEIPPELASQGE